MQITLASPWSLSDGYGRVGLLDLLALRRKGVRVSPMPCGWVNPAGFDESITRELHKDTNLQTEWGVVHGPPQYLGVLPTPKKIVWTMWEATRIYPMWAEILALTPKTPIIVPSSGQIEIFRDSGVTNPMHVVPDCIQTDAFDFPIVADRRPNPEEFTVIHWSHMQERKCPYETIDVFMEALGHHPNVKLILKTSNGMFGPSGKPINVPKDPRIELVDQIWTQDELLAVVRAVDAGLFLSHGEGFYLEPLEATLTGLPCIVPTHSGCADWASDDYFYPVCTKGIVRNTDPAIFGDCDWWEMDYRHAVERLREIYENYDLALEKARRGAEWVRASLSPDAVAERFIDALRAIMRQGSSQLSF